MTYALPYLALTMGLLSSFHCIGMCGPIALALPVHTGSKFRQFAGVGIYNGGRALTYAALGLAFGTVGSSLVWMGYLRYLSIFTGVLMLIYVFWPSRMNGYLHTPAFWERSVHYIKKRMSEMLRSRKMHGWLMLGILNGLLPCGLVYLALISSVATGSTVGGGIYMLLFGVGTLPAMMAVGFFRQCFTPALRTRMHKLTPVVLSVAGIWLIARGVFIEYPSAGGVAASIPVCHGR